MNELFIILLVYLVWVLSDITEKGKTKHEIGYIYCGLIVIFLLFNLAAIAFLTLKQFRLKRKLNKLHIKSENK